MLPDKNIEGGKKKATEGEGMFLHVGFVVTVKCHRSPDAVNGVDSNRLHDLRLRLKRFVICCFQVYLEAETVLAHSVPNL